MSGYWPTARDESRVKARRGKYIDRNRITVAAYLDDWIDSHATEIKPRAMQDYWACLRLYVKPRSGHLQVQAVRPSTITKLYRDLLGGGSPVRARVSAVRVLPLAAASRRRRITPVGTPGLRTYTCSKLGRRWLARARRRI